MKISNNGNIRILGIDPGLVHTGWGVIDYIDNKIKYVACGTISPPPKDKMAIRLSHIYKKLSDVIEEYSVNECAVEEVFMNKNPDASLRLGQARGIALVVPSILGLEVFEYQNRMVKKSVTGSGRAGKEQVEAMVKMLLSGAEIFSEHSSDALAIAIAHSNMRNYNLLSNIK